MIVTHLTCKEREIVCGVLRLYAPGIKVHVFKSHVSGRYLKGFSNLDLVLMTKERMPIREWAHIKDTFKLADLPFRVDVLEWAIKLREFRKIIKGRYEVEQSVA